MDAYCRLRFFPSAKPAWIGIASAGIVVKDRGPLLRLASLVLDDDPGSGRVSNDAGFAEGKNLITILRLSVRACPSPEPEL
ncbi:MAG: hypothetical protein AUI36_36245 [Cyanobacteria bacterium 13_1_40CM_2_61_4]|nr:MAG: hypothetical protein AUI36_36245 [Cyanobacteria bacterium 13_1_40CM_2_61_4]